jgi:general secretion pathway protein G
MKSRGSLLLLIALIATGAHAATEVTASADDGPWPKATRYMPKDPLAVWAADAGSMAVTFDAIVATIQRFLPAEDAAKVTTEIAEMDAKLGFSLRDDFLAHIGPDMGLVIDLPPIDQAAGLIMSGAEDGINQSLDGIALWLEIDDQAKVSRAVERLVSLTGTEVEIEKTQQHVRVCWSPPAAEGEPPPPCLYYATTNGALVVGFTPERIAAMQSPAPADARVTAGDDFTYVAAELDADPRSLLYVNLPRVRRLIDESQMVTGLLAANDEAKPVLELLLDPSMTPHGMGTTTTLVGIGAGTRKVTFGPSWISTGVATTGIVAAIAIPNMLNAINRARQKRTMADIRTIGTVMEAFAVDNMAYPETDGWVACSELAGVVSPTYIAQLPAADGWEGPFSCLSDGRHYVIVSAGRDRVLASDYGGELETTTTTDFDADIVYRDGAFVIYPEGAQN